MTTFVSLLGSQKKIKVATLIDFQKCDQQTIENLYRKKLLAKKNVHIFTQYTGTREADIEDMFEPQLYLDAVNAEYAKELVKPIKLDDLGKYPRILVNIEEWLEANPIKDRGLQSLSPGALFSRKHRHARTETKQGDP